MTTQPFHVPPGEGAEPTTCRPGPPTRRGGFTLLEVVLALSIAIALLVVVLYYYQQAARLRDSTLEATAGLAAVRLCMDRLGTELRTASTQPGSFRGGPQELEFLLCDLPEPSTDAPSEAAGETFTPLPLRRIRYALPTGEDPTATSSLMRTETALTTSASTAAASDDPSALAPWTTPAEPTGPTVPLAPSEEEPADPTVPPDTPALGEEVEAASPADSPTEEGTRLTTAFPGSGTLALAVPEVRFLRLRYHDGATWLDAWAASTLPRGIEITLALEPAAPDAGPDALPGEVFRRTIALTTSPASAPDDARAAGLTDRWDPTEDGL